MKEKYFCKICNKKIGKNTKTGLCLNCYNDLNAINKPSKEILEEELKNNTIISLSKKYNVSNSTMQRWVQSYGLHYNVELAIKLSHVTINNLNCIQCGKERELGRRYCRECYLENKRKRAKDRYKEFGGYEYTIICYFCGNEYKAGKKTQKFCDKCWKERLQFITKYHSTNQYENKFGQNKHRQIAESILKRKLTYNEVVHHLDHNPINNSLDNLILLHRKDHVALHNYLYDYEFKLYKSYGDKYTKYWNGNIEKETTLEYLNSNNIFHLFFANSL